MSSHPVPAPQGYEAIACFNVDSKAWNPYFRKVGAALWTQCRPFGHGQLPTEDVVQRAAEIIAVSIPFKVVP